MSIFYNEYLFYSKMTCTCDCYGKKCKIQALKQWMFDS